MRQCLIVAFLSIALLSCKKFVQQQEQNAIVQVMTNGVWWVGSYELNDSSITGIFNGYTFQFESNGTVNAIDNGTTTATGTWVGNLDSETIMSNFIGASSPLNMLNTTWKIENTTDTSVLANSMIAGDTATLVLYNKKP
ncbi:MAG TPA: hypothetical protein VKR32_20125 [Puia sp.]|nr:hypothetical protein [Puia sp.]